MRNTMQSTMSGSYEHRSMSPSSATVSSSSSPHRMVYQAVRQVEYEEEAAATEYTLRRRFEEEEEEEEAVAAVAAMGRRGRHEDEDRYASLTPQQRKDRLVRFAEWRRALIGGPSPHVSIDQRGTTGDYLRGARGGSSPLYSGSLSPRRPVYRTSPFPAQQLSVAEVAGMVGATTKTWKPVHL